MVGQETIIRLLLVSLFSRGHCLLIGVPGLAKTLLVRSLAETLTLSFKRIQFTPDLMPSDIIGSELLQERDRKLEFEYFAGPIFANLLLADEVNRTPPKTQSALLEAMQEHQVTVAGASRAFARSLSGRGHAEPHRAGRHLSAARGAARPFHVFAAPRLSRRTRRKWRSCGAPPCALAEQLAAVVSLEEILAAQQLVLAAPVGDHVIDYAVRLAASTRPAPRAGAAGHARFCRMGRRPARLAVPRPRGQGAGAARGQGRRGNRATSAKSRCPFCSIASSPITARRRGKKVARHRRPSCSAQVQEKSY